MYQSVSWARRFFLSGLFVLGCMVALSPPTAAQRARPDAAMLPSANPLCDGISVPCLDIDDLAAHVYAHLHVLPHTDQRDTAAVMPFGVALGLFGRVTGGISTHYAFWNEGNVTYQQLGPLRLNLTLRLWPLFPLGSADGGTETPGAEKGHYDPPRGLRLGLAYEHEVRVWQFDGANSLGMLTDLAALRFLGSRMFGPIQLSASLGALYDWHGHFATGEAAAQVGLYLPGFRALKVYVEALGRGVPAYMQKDAQLGPAGQAPIHPQSMMGLGLSFHPHARVDLGVSVHRGFAGLAPWAVSIQFLTLSVGKTYQGRAATPVAKLAAEVTTEAAVALKEFIDKLPIDPTLDEDCQILDYDNATILGQFGKRTKSGFYCEQDGFLVPIRHELLRNKKNTKLCRDDGLKDCLLERQGKQWVPVHRPRLDGACRMTDSDGTVLGSLGEPTADGKRCHYQGARENGGYGKHPESQELPIGTLFHTDADRTAVCVDEAMRHCFMRPPAGRHTLAWGDDARASTALLGGIGEGFVEQAQDAKAKVTRVATVATKVATGKVKLSTVYGEAKQVATEVVTGGAELIKDPEKRTAAINAARAKVARLEKSIEDWREKTPEEQLEDGLRAGGRLISHGATAVIVGGGTRAALEGVGLVNTTLEGAEAEAALVKTAQKGKKAAQSVEHNVGQKALPPAPAPRGSRFIADEKGRIVDKHATPPGRYVQPDRSATDILQDAPHPDLDPFTSRTHTHQATIHVNPKNPAQGTTTLEKHPRPVSTQDVLNIINGTAVRGTPKGR